MGLQLLACWDCGFKPCRRHECLPLWVLCFVGKRCLYQADHSSRGVLPNVECPMSWPRSPIRGGHDPESGRSATGKQYFYLYQWNILTTGLTTVPRLNLYRSSSGYSKCNEVFTSQYCYCIVVFIILVLVVLIFVLGDILGTASWWCGVDTRLCCLVISKFVYRF